MESDAERDMDAAFVLNVLYAVQHASNVHIKKRLRIAMALKARACRCARGQGNRVKVQPACAVLRTEHRRPLPHTLLRAG